MKYLAVLTASLLLAACNTTTNPDTTATASAVDPLVGKTLVGPQATFLFNADGTVGGKFRDDPIEGTYTSSATEICSTYTAPANFVDLGEICSKPAISNGKVTFNRRDGSQSAEYSIEG